MYMDVLQRNQRKSILPSGRNMNDLEDHRYYRPMGSRYHEYSTFDLVLLIEILIVYILEVDP
jgi:hypothetical protein